VRLLVAANRLEASGLLAGGIPEGIRHVLGRRLNRLPEAVNAILAAACVQGREFDLDVVARAAGLSSDEVLDSLEEAMDARLVAEAGTRPGRFRFAHALVRETLEVRLLEEALAVLGETDGILRARVLGRLAKALQSSADPDRRVGLSETAVAMARRIGDPVALAAVLYDRHMATWRPGTCWSAAPSPARSCSSPRRAATA